jgi:hypothetical protein
MLMLAALLAPFPLPRREICPTMLDYATQAENDSMYNTPPCWTIYICGLVFARMLEKGGLPAALQNNERVRDAPVPGAHPMRDCGFAGCHALGVGPSRKLAV